MISSNSADAEAARGGEAVRVWRDGQRDVLQKCGPRVDRAARLHRSAEVNLFSDARGHDPLDDRRGVGRIRDVLRRDVGLVHDHAALRGEQLDNLHLLRINVEQHAGGRDDGVHVAARQQRRDFCLDHQAIEAVIGSVPPDAEVPAHAVQGRALGVVDPTPDGDHLQRVFHAPQGGREQLEQLTDQAVGVLRVGSGQLLQHFKHQNDHVTITTLSVPVIAFFLASMAMLFLLQVLPSVLTFNV